MIFASVGSMLPFDRFVQAVDEWAEQNSDVPVLIQIGDGEYEPEYAEYVRMMSHQKYVENLKKCQLFVAHVGMGSILQALEHEKQMLLLPRQAALREHTTDHQLATAAKFRDTPGLVIVDDIGALKSGMNTLLDKPLATNSDFNRFAPPDMISRVENFIHSRG